MRVGATNFGNAINCFVGSLDHEVKELHFVQNAEWSALLAGTVVRHHHDDGVVELAERLKFIDQSADLCIGVLKERTKCFLQRKSKLLLVLRKRIPRLNAGITWCKLRICGNQTEFDLLCEPTFAGNIPAFIVLAAMTSEILLGRLMRRVRSAKSEIREERTIWSDRDCVVNELDRFVDQIFAEVIALGRSCRWVDAVIVVHEVGGELIGFAIEETVEAVKTSLQRPRVVRAGSRSFVHGTQMPLPERKRRVANVTQHLAHRCCMFRNTASHMRIAGVEICDAAHADRVVIAASEQCCSSRRTQRRHVEV